LTNSVEGRSSALASTAAIFSGFSTAAISDDAIKKPGELKPIGERPDEDEYYYD
jgi:hypothetical protein